MNGPLLTVLFYDILRRVKEGRPVLVGFTGPAGVGKSTLASVFDYYFAQQGQPVLRISFAWFLKSFMRNNLGINKETDPELYRKLAQQIGTELLRNEVTPDFHVKKLMEYVGEASKNVKVPPVVIIDDVRFANEAAVVDYLFFPVPISEERRAQVLENIPKHESECPGWLFPPMKNWYFLLTPDWRDAQGIGEFLNMLSAEKMAEAPEEVIQFAIEVIEKGCPRVAYAYVAAEPSGGEGND